MDSHPTPTVKAMDQLAPLQCELTATNRLPQLIDAMRHKIDLLDSTIIRLLGERNEVSQTLQCLKHSLCMPIYQPQREEEVLARIASEGTKCGLPADLTKAIYLLILRQYVDPNPSQCVHDSIPTIPAGD